MSRNAIITLVAGLVLLGQAALAQSSGYHLERLQIQARAFQEALAAEPAPPGSVSEVGLEQQLEMSTSNSVWSRQMVNDDVSKILTAAQELSGKLQGQPSPEQLLSARSTVESLGRRLRVSSAALTLSPHSRTALDFLLLELEESARGLEAERDQLLAQERQQRARVSLRTGFSVGYGYGYDYGYHAVPYGWGTYYPYGNAFGPGPFYPGAYGYGPRGCR